MTRRAWGDWSPVRLWNQYRRIPLKITAGLTILGIAGLVWMWAMPPLHHADLSPGAITGIERRAFTAPIPPPRGMVAVFFQFDRDSATAPTVSKLHLYENGRALGPAHAARGDISALGAGRYAHWDDHLVFSTSDNSDPRSNGRNYRVDAPLSPRFRLQAIAMALLLAGGVGAVASLAPRAAAFARKTSWTGAGVCFGAGVLALAIGYTAGSPRLRTTSLVLLFLGVSWALIASGLTRQQILQQAFDGSRVDRLPRWAVFVWIVSGVSAALAIYMTMLLRAASPGLGLAGYFQVSDASGYWDCANQFIDDGAVSDWCHRRPVYSLFLSGAAIVGGRNLELVLMFQAALVGICTLLFAREVARWLGLVAGLFVCVTVALYAWTFVFGQTMTEVLGLSLGLISGAMLLRAGDTRSFPLALFGLFLLSAALLVRPGGLFVLPLAALWAGLLRGTRPLPFIVGVALAGLSIAAGFVLNMGAIAAVGGDPALANANFPQTLYGLSVGRDWSSLIADHPDLVAETRETVREAYRLAFENIRAHPGVFLNSLKDNLLAYLDSPWYRELVPLSLLRQVIVLAGIIVAGIASRRSLRAALVLSFAAGELMSSVLLTRDATVRVWAATAPLAEAAVAALLIVMLARWALRRHLIWELPGNDESPSGRSWDKALLSTGSVAFALILVALSPLRLVLRTPEFASAPSCGSNLRSVVVNTSASAWLAITERAGARTSASHQVSRQAIAGNFPSGSWVAESVSRLADVQLIRAIEVGPGLGAPTPLYAPSDLDLPRAASVALCVDDTDKLDIASAGYSRIVLVRAAEAPSLP